MRSSAGAANIHHSPWPSFLLWPGLVTQRLTALEPDDSQLEVALAALKAVLAREEHPLPEGHLAAAAIPCAECQH